MTNIKSYTDLEQSKKLEEILPKESADMFWLVLGDTPRVHVLTEPLSNYNRWENYPCWSLAALLSALPYFIGDYGKCLYCDVGGYYCGYMVDGKFMLSIEETNADNPVDAVFEMVLKLHEQKLL